MAAQAENSTAAGSDGGGDANSGPAGSTDASASGSGTSAADGSQADGSGGGFDDNGQWIPIELGEPAEFGELPTAESSTPPFGWVLLAANARVTVGQTLTFGGAYSTCSALLARGDDQVIFNANFQHNEAHPLGPNFSYTDRGDGTILWGLYIGEGGERGEEWSGKPTTGSPTLRAVKGEFAVAAPFGISLDPANDGLEPDGTAFGLIATWSGEANENFTSETTAASVEVRCIFAPRELVDILADSIDSFRSS